MKKLRLLLWNDCNRNCPGCCNNDWNLDALEKTTNFKGYSEIILTGGEPMLKPLSVTHVCQEIRLQTTAKIYMYTAKVNDLTMVNMVLKYIDGITLTLHTKNDVFDFKKLNNYIMCRLGLENKSLRLNVFKGINMGSINLSKWKVRDNIEWMKDCPLPEGEVFKRLGT